MPLCSSAAVFEFASSLFPSLLPLLAPTGVCVLQKRLKHHPCPYLQMKKEHKIIAKYHVYIHMYMDNYTILHNVWTRQMKQTDANQNQQKLGYSLAFADFG